jgi:putative transposase
VSVAEADRRLGIGENLVRLWKKTFLDHEIEAFPEPGRLSPAAQELQRLRAEWDLLKKPPPTSPAPELTFRFIADHQYEFPVAWVCDALEVSASRYHAWIDRESPRWQWRA